MRSSVFLRGVAHAGVALVWIVVTLIGGAGPMARAAEGSFETDRRAAEARCRADYSASAFFDCACVGEEVAKDIAASGKPHAGARDSLAHSKCPPKDGKGIEESTFKSCDSSLASQRTDHAQFCRCAAQNFTREYLANPNYSGRYMDMLRRNAFGACGMDNGAMAPKPSRTGPEWTPAGLEKQRAEQEANCRSNSVTAVFNDCSCAARTMAELATAPGESRPLTSFVNQAYEACPQQDRPVIARDIFDSCDSYMSSVRTDHESFCKCTADGFVQAFYADKPQMNMRWREKLRRDAMQACGLGDASKRIVTTTAVDSAVAAAGCVKFYSNEKRILKSAAMNKRLGGTSAASPDVVLVNECGKTIRLNTHIEYAVPRPNAPQECALKRVFPGEQVEVRSQSRVVRPGLEKRIPALPLFLCLGDVTEAGVNSFKSDCSCGAFQRVDIPLGETLKPLP